MPRFIFLNEPVLFAYSIVRWIESSDEDKDHGNCRQSNPFDTEIPAQSHRGERAFKGKKKKNDISEAIPNLPIQSYKKNLAFMFKSNKEKQEKETNLL